MISLSRAWTANTVHDFTARPSMRTVQAPQWVVSHPIWVPVSRSTSRIRWTSRRRGSTLASCFSPLIESLTHIASPPFAGALQGFAERAGRQHSDHVPLVLDRPAEILAGLGRLCAELGGALDGGVVWPVALEGCLRPRGLDGSETDAGEADPDLVAGAAGAERELRRHGDCGEVADLALELEVGAPAAGRWNRHADLHEDLVGLERGRERAGEERCDGDPALALRACGDDLGAEREHRRGVVVGGIAVGEVAAERGEVAHEGIRDDLAGVVEQGIAGADEVGLLQLRFAREGTDPKKAVRLADERKSGNAVDVDEVPGAGQAELHERDEALASGEDLGLLTELCEQSRRLGDRTRRVIVKGGRNHRGGPLALLLRS